MKLFALLVLCASTALSQVWVCSDGTRVFKPDTAHWSRTVYDTCWDGTTVRLTAAKNEIVAFQIIISGGASGLDSVNVSFDTLAKGSDLIINTPGADSTQYVGRNIELFVEHYTNVTEFNGGETSAGATPDDSVWQGWMPDALIPIKAARGSYANGQGGGPFDISADSIQGVWCDVYIPKTFPAGTYTGNIRIWQGESITQSIPVSLIVKNFTLPDTTHMINFMWSWWGDFSGIIPDMSMDSVHLKYPATVQKHMNLFHRHRIGVMTNVSFTTFDSVVGGYITGSAFSADNGYAGPGTGVGFNCYSIGTYDCPQNPAASSFTPDNESGWQAASDLWEQWFIDSASTTPHWKYSWDEPFNSGPAFPLYDSIVVWNGDSIRYPFAWIGDRCAWIAAGTGVGQNLQTLVTVAHLDAEDASKYWPDLQDLGFKWYVTTGHVSQWQGYNVDEAQAGRTADDLRALGSYVGVYNDLRPEQAGIGWWDLPQTEHRAAPWTWWKYRCSIYYLWCTSYQWSYKRETSAYDSALVAQNNPWLNPFGQFASMIYPGTDSLFLPGDSRGWDGPIASIRMKMLRRGLQDYEYLWLADSAGINADSLADVVTPNAFNDPTDGWDNLTDQATYDHNSKFFETIRLWIADQLHVPLPSDQKPVTGARRRVVRKTMSTE